SGTLSPMTAHLHPINNPALNPGINFEILSFSEAGTNNGDGKIQPGEKIAVKFQMTNDAQNAVSVPAWLSGGGSVNVAISGPTTNRNLLLNTSLPLGGFAGSGPYTTNVPEVVQLEYVGDSTAGIDTFTTSRAPHWATTTTTVQVRTAF